MKTVLIYVRLILAQLATLTNPATDAALAAVVLKLLPFVHVDTTVVLDLAAAVGLVATWLQRVFAGVSAKAKAVEAAKAGET
jgi:hypothetical protein